MMRRIIAPFFLIPLLFLGCSNHFSPGDLGSGESALDPGEAASVAGAALAGAANMGATGSGAISMRKPQSRLKSFFVGEKAYAAVNTCGLPAANDTCTGTPPYTRAANYASCAIINTPYIYSGAVTLTYSTAACALSTTGDTLTRTLNVSRSGILGTTVTTSSDTATDFKGNSISGGSQLVTINPATPSYQLSILGLHKVRKNAGGTILHDITVRTPNPFVVQGSLAGGARSLSSGSLEVTHNLAKYVATFTAVAPLTFSDAGTCCHPTSGTLNIAFTGAVSGSGSLTYNATCGSATLSFGGTTTPVTLYSCE